ncbi:MAG: type IV secretory system conjugative DNA transfer family protein [Streptosporangiaceae bacterium]
MSDFLRMYWDVNKALVKGAAKVGAKAGTALSGAVGDYSAGRGARRGILAPGDPAPPPAAGGSYYDFRGVLALRSVPEDLQDAEFPLGRYVHPAKGSRQPIGLPAGVVAHHVAVVAPTGAGKTTSIIVPWILAGLRAGWRVVTVDVKGDLVDLLQREALRSSQPLCTQPTVLDYTHPTRSVKWNWLAEIDSDRAIDNAVQSILGKEPPPKSDPYFFHLDSQILRGLLELTSISPRRSSVTASRLLEVLKDQGKLSRMLAHHPGSAAAGRLRDLPPLDPDEYSKRVSGVAIRLDALARPMIEAVTNRADLRVEDVLRAPGLVSVVAPVQDGQMAAMLSSLFINQVLFRAYNRFASSSGVPLLLVLDEAKQLEDRVDFESLLSVARAAQVAALIAVQDVRQFKDESQRSIIFSNCGTLIYLSGASSESAELLSRRVGQHPVQASSVSVGPSSSGWGTSTSRSAQTQLVPLLGAREIMDLPFGPHAAVVHSRQLADRPFLVDLTRS